ncbi:MAG: hypothetical protein LBV38_01420 [Alistipes sp.]|jgi:hypothetical protein|nr:hypothetical protein [Alistipes sp.]
MTTLLRHIATAACLALLSTGCEEDDRYLRADPSSVEIAADSTSDIAVTVESSSRWLADPASAPEWLSLSYDDALSLLWLRLAGTNESLEERRAEILLISGDGLELTVPVVQRAMDVFFEVSPHELTIFGARNAATQTLTIDTPLEWEFSILEGGEWAKATREENTNTLDITTDATHMLEERRTAIALRPVNDAFRELADTVAVVQRGLDLLAQSTLMNPTTFEIELPAEGGDAPISVYAKGDWTAATDSPDLTLDLAGGGADIENGTLLTLTAGPNPTPESRTFTLTFTCEGESYEYTITQKAPEEQQEPAPEP